MEKIVKDGLRDCTLVLDGSECEVRFDTCFRAFAVRNDSGADVFISKTSGIVPDADGVMCVRSGGSAVFAHNDLDKNAVYLLGTGKVMVHGQQDSNNPFNFAPTIDGGVQASGNPVVMDNLQEGVPFSEMVVRGKNLLTYPYYHTTHTNNGITFTDNGNGTIAVDGTASSDSAFYLVNKQEIIPSGTSVYLSGCPAGGSGSSYDIVLVTFDENNTAIDVYNDVGNGKYIAVSGNTKTVSVYIRIRNGQTISNLIFRPQLELGSTPTAYEPPITGRELTVNVNGTDYTITPDTNPYIIPNDIRQQDGLNNISVSEGELSVVGVRKNAALKKIWDDIDEIKTAIIVSNGESE